MIPTLKQWMLENVPLEFRDEASALFDDEHCQLKYIEGAYNLGLRTEREQHRLVQETLNARIEGLKIALQDKANVTQRGFFWIRRTG